MGQIQCRLTVESDLSVLTSLQDWLDEFCDRQPALSHWSDDRRYCLKLALAEGFSNAVRHAHRHRSRHTPIDLEIRLDDGHLRIYIWDFGDPFNPNQLEEPKPGTLRQGGYGWFLLRRLCDRVTYRRDRYGRNCLAIEQALANP